MPSPGVFGLHFSSLRLYYLQFFCARFRRTYLRDQLPSLCNLRLRSSCFDIHWIPPWDARYILVGVPGALVCCFLFLSFYSEYLLSRAFDQGCIRYMCRGSCLRIWALRLRSGIGTVPDWDPGHEDRQVLELSGVMLEGRRKRLTSIQCISVDRIGYNGTKGATMRGIPRRDY